MNSYNTTSQPYDRLDANQAWLPRLALTALIHAILFFALIRSNSSFYARCVGIAWQTKVWQISPLMHWVYSLGMWYIYLAIARRVMCALGIHKLIVQHVDVGFNIWIYLRRFAIFAVLVLILNALLGFVLSYTMYKDIGALYMNNLFWISLFDTMFGFLLMTLEEVIAGALKNFFQS